MWSDHHAPQDIVFNTPSNKYLASYSQFSIFLREILNNPAGQNGSPGAAPRSALTIQTATAGRKNDAKIEGGTRVRLAPGRPFGAPQVVLNQKRLSIYTPILHCTLSIYTPSPSAMTIYNIYCHADVILSLSLTPISLTAMAVSITTIV